MKKVVLKLELHDDKVKQRAMKTVSGLSGIDSVAIDMKDKKLTVTGDIDPVTVVTKLRKLCHTEMVTVGPAKEEKKKDEPKKDEAKKGDEKKKDPKAELEQLMRDYYYRYPPVYAYYGGAEEDPRGCVIC